MDQIAEEPEEREELSITEPIGRTWKNKPQQARSAMTQSRVTLMGEHLRIIEEKYKARLDANRTEVMRYSFEIIAILALLPFIMALIFSLLRRQTRTSLTNLAQRVTELKYRVATHEVEVEDRL
jgi:hypothetical protein